MTPPNPAEAYERFYVPSFFAPMAGALLDRVRPSPEDRVLDVACGTGIVARTVRERVGMPQRLTGIDINPAMVALAKTLAPFAEFQTGNANALDFEAGSFDSLFCQHGLMFFPDRPKALTEMRRVLRPGGRLALSTWRPLGEHPLSEALIAAGRRHVDVPIDLPYSLGNAAELRGAIEAAGFVDVAVETVEFQARYPDASTFVKMTVMAFGAVMPRFATMTDGDRAAFVGAIESETADVVARHRDGTGIAFNVRANVATGTAG
jgi:ubiquinone/menaquinone biosynthesis C-methylase UbiE